ncbi:MAG: NnrS family protein [Sinobacteraceae bacterium]|nr:NnrS family protein [Nevskiaceae bacterium]MCP5466770.1 NnrS family protein [Nevskiaceae bacterium]
MAGTGQLPLFTYGFRTFFVAAGLSALILIPLWAIGFGFQWPLNTDWPPAAWHGHEMLFGFVCAAIAGFLLTAVPSWTGQKGFGGAPLMLMAAVWLLGRLLVGSSAVWPFVAVAVADLAFLAVLALFLAPPLLRERNRNTPLLAVLLLLWLCNAGFHLGLWRGDALLSRQTLLAGINLVLILVTVVAGRMLPPVTTAALRQQGTNQVVRPSRSLTPSAVTFMIAVAVVDLIRPNGLIAGGIALAAAIAQGLRIAQWQGYRVLRHPLVWVLHLAYVWLPIGLLLKALALLTGVAAATHWLHALTIGAIATMILGVMTRVTLGHTGHRLQALPRTPLAYGLLTAAALLRVFGTALPWISYPALIAMSAALWTAGFGLFLRIYGPLLLAPRADGKRG